MTAESITPEPPPSTDASLLPENPDAEGSVLLDGVRYYPFGDLTDRARFLQDVLAGSNETKRRALAAIGATPTLELMEQDGGKLPDDRLDYVLLAVHSQRIEEIGEDRGAQGRLKRGLLGEPHYPEVNELFHADMGMQIAAALEGRGFLQTPPYIDAFRSVPRSRFLLKGMEWAGFIDAPCLSARVRPIRSHRPWP